MRRAKWNCGNENVAGSIRVYTPYMTTFPPLILSSHLIGQFFIYYSHAHFPHWFAYISSPFHSLSQRILVFLSTESLSTTNMISKLAIALLGIYSATASPLRKHTHNTQPAGTNPIQVASTAFLGKQTAENSCSVRDLGFTGQISGVWYGVYGETLFCSAGATDPSQSTGSFSGMVRDSISMMTPNILKTHDLNLDNDAPVAHQNQFIPSYASWGDNQSYGFGGTSLCSTFDFPYYGNAAVFYVVVHLLTEVSITLANILRTLTMLV
jgi:hypothetical protein